MKYIFFFLTGVCAFVCAYFLNTSTKVKQVSLADVSRELNSNRQYAEEIERFNQRGEPGPANVERPVVESYLATVVTERNIDPILYSHLTQAEPTPESFQQQIADMSELAKKDPQKVIEDSKSLLDTLKSNDKMMEYGITMVQMSQVPELREHVAMMAKQEIAEANVKEIDPRSVQSLDEENRRLSDDPKVNSMNMLYHAYLNTQMAAENNPMNETIDFIVRNSHSDIRRSIASVYVQAYPQSYDDLMAGLKNENITITNVPKVAIPERSSGGNQ